MVNKLTIRLSILVTMLSIVFVFFYYFENRTVNFNSSAKKEISLDLAFQNIPGWPGLKSFPLTEDIINSLSLDDYLYRGFGKSNHQVNLYIGYYWSAQKVGISF